MNDNNVFPFGVVVFFRMGTNDGLARSVLPHARQVIIGSRAHDAHDDDYVVADHDGRPLGYYPRDFVAAILPIDPPAGAQINVDNPAQSARN